MNKFIITEGERERILGMHKKSTSRHYLMESTIGNVKPLLNESDVMEKYAEPQKLMAKGVLADLMFLISEIEEFNKTVDVNKIMEMACSVTRGKKSYPKYNVDVKKLQALINLIIKFNNKHKKFISVSMPLIADYIKFEFAKDSVVTKMDTKSLVNFLDELIKSILPTTTISEDGFYGKETDSILCEFGAFGFFFGDM